MSSQVSTTAQPSHGCQVPSRGHVWGFMSHCCPQFCNTRLEGLHGCWTSPTLSLTTYKTYFKGWTLRSLHSASVCNFCLLFIPSFGRIKYQNNIQNKEKKKRNKQTKCFPLNISIPSKATLQWLWEDSWNVAVKWLLLKRNNFVQFQGNSALLDGNTALHKLHAAYG